MARVRRALGGREEPAVITAGRAAAHSITAPRGEVPRRNTAAQRAAALGESGQQLYSSKI